MFSFHRDIVRETEGFCTKMIWHGYTEIMAQNRQITNPNHNTSEHVFFSSKNPPLFVKFPRVFPTTTLPASMKKAQIFQSSIGLDFVSFSEK